ncbi:hypothetical protein [Nitrosospira lacus]|uniref:hypothetical protein n=1 Tax=Nitrosospira lacus TaxID=1288494 RepID=UPI001D1317CE|nr:hypothetical protein [Nitrosospira lacus]
MKKRGNNEFAHDTVIIRLFTIIPAHAVEKADEKRLDEVAHRGAHVMPFDLEKTTSIFSKTANGGLKQSK